MSYVSKLQSQETHVQCSISEYNTIEKALDKFKNEVSNNCPEKMQEFDYDQDEIVQCVHDIHVELCEYWNQFGFLNKSNNQDFLSVIKKNIRVEKIDTQDFEDDAIYSD